MEGRVSNMVSIVIYVLKFGGELLFLLQAPCTRKSPFLLTRGAGLRMPCGSPLQLLTFFIYLYLAYTRQLCFGGRHGCDRFCFQITTRELSDSCAWLIDRAHRFRHPTVISSDACRSFGLFHRLAKRACGSRLYANTTAKIVTSSGRCSGPGTRRWSKLAARESK